jgi:2-polyprenyl-3-methyl-5-hydroxy-6-metoxy-1,4-benzoquinol methylase
MDRNRKAAIRERFDRLAVEREVWQKRNRYYYDDQQRFFRFLVPEGLRVLEVGCGLGDLLASLRPVRGLGLDLSEAMVKEASRRHPSLEFRVADVETLELEGTFDVIILADVVGHLLDAEAALKRLRRCCTPGTRLIISYYNFLWEPVLRLAERIGLKMPQQHQNWLALEDLANVLHLADYEVVKTELRLLLPKWVPIVSAVANRFLAFLPGFRSACLCQYLVARPVGMKRPPHLHLSPSRAREGKEDFVASLPQEEREGRGGRAAVSSTTASSSLEGEREGRGGDPVPEYSVSIIIPCRNERGNIEAAVRRLPAFGSRQEIIFVEGHSSDGTAAEIERVRLAHPNRNIRMLVQEGKGKGDAVRLGFAQATGDVLMILDADLTMPPEDLPKFYHALASGKGEFINGCRLVYPMDDQAMRALNLLGNKFFSMVFSWLLSQRIKDTLCGTKVLFREDYRRIAANRSYFGDFDPFGDFDLLFGASKLNLKILEVPIRYRERAYGETNIRRFAHGWLLLKMTVYGFSRLKSL